MSWSWLRLHGASGHLFSRLHLRPKEGNSSDGIAPNTHGGSPCGTLLIAGSALIVSAPMAW